MFIRAISIYTFQLMNLFKLLDDSCEIIGSYIHQVMAAQVQHSKSIENLWITDHASTSNKFHDRLRVAGEYVEKLTEIHAKLRMETIAFQLMNSVPVTSSITTGSIGIIAKVNAALYFGSMPLKAKTQNPSNFSFTAVRRLYTLDVHGRVKDSAHSAANIPCDFFHDGDQALVFLVQCHQSAGGILLLLCPHSLCGGLSSFSHHFRFL